MARRLYLGSTSFPHFFTQGHPGPILLLGLPPDARSEEVNKFFDGYGRIVDCRVMTGQSSFLSATKIQVHPWSPGFGFVEFENSKDAEDAVHNLNGKSFMGTTWATVSSPLVHHTHPVLSIVVEFAKESRPRRDPYEGERNHG